MSIYVNAFVMLLATIAALVVLAKLAQAIRSRSIALPWRVGGGGQPAARLAVEQACMLDSKRRLWLVRCDEQRVLLLTGGPSDLVVSVLAGGPRGDGGA
jgi:flagellar protein FliO/FliZ